MSAQPAGDGDKSQINPDKGPPGSFIIDKLIDVDTPDITDAVKNAELLTAIEQKQNNISQSPSASILCTINTLEEQLAPLQLESSSQKNDHVVGKNATPLADHDQMKTPTKCLEAGDTGITVSDPGRCSKCRTLEMELDKAKAERSTYESKVISLKDELVACKNELDREIQKRVEFEQQFTEKSDRVKDQITEFIAKSNDVDAKCEELRKRLEFYNRNSSTMSENFTTDREMLTSQLLELKNENAYLLGQYLSRAQELQSAEIDLPQSVEDLQFHCLTLNEKLILATMAKERLEETLARESSSASMAAASTRGATSPNSSSMLT